MFPFRKAKRIAFHTVPWDGSVIANVDLSPASIDSARRRLADFLSGWLHLASEDDVYLVGSGRTAIELGLSALSKLDPKRGVVVVPSYTCQAVLNAVLNAGLTPRFIDTTDRLISSVRQYADAATSDVLCVILINLCGKRLSPSEREEFVSEMQGRRIFTIEDNCQDFSSEFQNARADMECYSLGFSKTLRATAGGVLVARQALREVASLLKEYSQQPAVDAGKRMIYYQAAYDPSMQKQTPELTGSFQNSRSEFGRVMMADLDIYLATAGIERLDGNMKSVSKHSREILRAMEEFPNVYRHQGSDHNCFTRLPVVLPDEALAAQFWSHMNARGIELEGMYNPLHLGFTGKGVLPNAEQLAKRIFNVPNRADLSNSDLKQITSAIRKFGKATKCRT